MTYLKEKEEKIRLNLLGKYILRKWEEIKSEDQAQCDKLSANLYQQVQV